MTQHPLPPRAGVTLLVAASDASETTIDRADFVCTGTNDHVTIAAAIGSLPLDGEDRCGTIQLSEGTFSIGATIQLPGHIQILGSGWGTKLLATPGMNAYLFTFVPHILPTSLAQGAEGICLAHLVLDQNAPMQTAGGCIDAYGARLCRFDSLYLRRPYNEAIRLRGLPDGTAGGSNSILSCVMDGGATSTGSGRSLLFTNNTKNTVMSCTFLGSAGAGSLAYTIVDQAGLNTYSQNTFTAPANAILVTQQNGVRLLGNCFDGVITTAITIDSANHVISGNTFSHLGGGGSGAVAAILNPSQLQLSNTIITGNVFSIDGGAITSYIQLNNATHICIEHNIFQSGAFFSLNVPTSATILLRHNSGFVTESSGDATIASGVSSVTLPTGIDPLIDMDSRYVHVTPFSFGSATKFWVTTSATSFTVTIDSTAGGFAFGWQIQVY